MVFYIVAIASQRDTIPLWKDTIAFTLSASMPCDTGLSFHTNQYSVAGVFPIHQTSPIQKEKTHMQRPSQF